MKHPILKHTKAWHFVIDAKDPSNMFGYMPLRFVSDDGKMWTLASGDFTCDCLGTKVTIPNGFKTNFASIPFCFWWLVGPPSGQGTGDCYVIPSMVHDALCRFKICPRLQADKIFLSLLKYVECNAIRASLMFCAVTLYSVIAHPFNWLRKPR